MGPLAGTEDYQARYGAAPESVSTLLEEASSIVRDESSQTISFVEGDVALIIGDGSRLLQLPELPVGEVTAVVVDGQTVPVGSWELFPVGQLWRHHGSWPDSRPVAVTYSHGWDEVPEWIVGLICSMVQRAVRPAAQLGVQAQTTGSQTVQYHTSLAGVNLWLTRQELDRLHRLRPPQVA